MLGDYKITYTHQGILLFLKLSFEFWEMKVFLLLCLVGAVMARWCYETLRWEGNDQYTSDCYTNDTETCSYAVSYLSVCLSVGPYVCLSGRMSVCLLVMCSSVCHSVMSVCPHSTPIILRKAITTVRAMSSTTPTAAATHVMTCTNTRIPTTPQ